MSVPRASQERARATESGPRASQERPSSTQIDSRATKIISGTPRDRIRTKIMKSGLPGDPPETPRGGSRGGLQLISTGTTLLVHTVCFINLNKILLVRVQEMPSPNQLKSQNLFHENSSPSNSYSVTLALTCAGRKLMAFSAYPFARRCLLRRPSGPNRPQWPPTSRHIAAAPLLHYRKLWGHMYV